MIEAQKGCWRVPSLCYATRPLSSEKESLLKSIGRLELLEVVPEPGMRPEMSEEMGVSVKPLDPDQSIKESLEVPAAEVLTVCDAREELGEEPPSLSNLREKTQKTMLLMEIFWDMVVNYQLEHMAKWRRWRPPTIN
ncbi:hypothetical protein GOP47_0015517 [Adiantum capillus-veneris]|uniref:Uncharacterized protein n=1 Tax=Adiantum capillus-veneris TaxID=13818 RepID=A0A9D4UJV1_ADICA|nr:hypothetical protein GOP47_0015517 [Adiantum capillus-veneris]